MARVLLKWATDTSRSRAWVNEVARLVDLIMDRVKNSTAGLGVDVGEGFADVSDRTATGSLAGYIAFVDDLGSTTFTGTPMIEIQVRLGAADNTGSIVIRENWMPTTPNRITIQTITLTIPTSASDEAQFAESIFNWICAHLQSPEPTASPSLPDAGWATMQRSTSGDPGDLSGRRDGNPSSQVNEDNFAGWWHRLAGVLRQYSNSVWSKDLPPVDPEVWSDAGPWIRYAEKLRRKVTIDPSNHLEGLLWEGRLNVERAWEERALAFRDETIAAGLVNPQHARSSARQFVESDEVEADLVADGDLEALEEFRHLRSTFLLPTRPPIVEGWGIDRLVDWAAGGLVGNCAWWLVTQVVRANRVADYDTERPLSSAEVQAFAELALQERLGETGELLLLYAAEQLVSRRSGHRTWVEVTEWKYVLLGVEVEYTVVFQSQPGAALPSMVKIATARSSVDRYRRVRDN